MKYVGCMFAEEKPEADLGLCKRSAMEHFFAKIIYS